MGRLFQDRKTTFCVACQEGVDLIAGPHDDQHTVWRCESCGNETVEPTIHLVPEGQGTFFDRPL